ncbi:MAG: hypothetical protein GEV11_04955 [Streptosporangiales bacterium]|nr:hypothetical protein [Streptosporangiales bacterium]
MVRRLAGAVVAALGLMAGLWLMLAPFALGTQPEGRDWTDPTTTEFFTGVGFAVVGLAGLLAFAAALRAELVARGLMTVRAAAPEPQPEPAQAAAPAADQDLAALLAPLAAALVEEMEQRGTGVQGDRTEAPPAPNGRARDFDPFAGREYR